MKKNLRKGIRQVKIINKDTRESMVLNMTPNIIFVSKHKYPKKEELKREKHKKRCYFCGFKDAVDKHHIIPRKDSRDTLKNNVIYLCPNHHYLIHRTDFKLIFCDGYFYLVSNLKEKVINPSEQERGKPKKCPLFIQKFTMVNGGLKQLENIKEKV